MLNVLVHLIGALQFSYSVYYDWSYVHIPREMPNGSRFGGKFVFLTFWNAIIQSLYFWVCLTNDLIGSNEISPKNLPLIRKFKDHLYCTIACPLSMFVAITFWGLYAIDRELVLPKILDVYFPTWLNHIMHTNILIFSLVELVCSFRMYPSRKKGLTALTTFMLVYLVWTFVIYAISGEWVYPVLEVLNWPQRIAFFVGLMLLIHCFYFLSELLNTSVWRSELKVLEAARSKYSEKKKAC